MSAGKATGSASARPYGGVPAEVRARERRVRLLDAGQELFGTVGISATTVKAVIDRAGLTQRYFYESFESVEALALGVVERLAADVSDRVLSAVAGRTSWADRGPGALGALVDVITSDPAVGRILLVETIGNGARLARWRRQLLVFGATILQGWLEDEPHVPPFATDGRAVPGDQITSLVLAGGVIEVLVAWLDGIVDATPAQLTERLVEVCAAAAPSTRS